MPRSKRQKLLRWLLMVTICLAGVVVATWMILPRPLDSMPLMERLLAAGSEATAFSEVVPHHNWDTVCYLDPYDTPSRRLPRHLDEDLTGFAFEPFDQSIAEEENGLAFIDHPTRTVLIYALNKIEKGRQPAIYEISGPRCLGRQSASFLVEHVNAPNRSFNRLVFLSEK